MRLTGVALALALAVAVAVTMIAPGCNQDPPPPSSQPEDPQYPAPTPIAMRAELKAAQLAGEPHEPVVANQKLIMPDDARLDALIGRRGSPIDHLDQVEPLELPVYIIIRNGEVATVSAANGEFQIGEKHRTTFQFLIDQLGESKMQLIPTDFYERRWAPFRPSAK